MGRAPCCDKANVKKGPWSPQEDAKLKAYIEQYGTGGNWIALPQKIGLKRCGKSCRLRWLNYLRPNIKHGGFSEEEDNIICNLYISIGSRWSIIAAQLPGRTDNGIKNYWNTKLKKKLLGRHKHSNVSRCPNANGVEENSSHTLSNSALERLQLHMQLQSQQDPLSFYKNPPKLHPLQGKMLLQSLNETSKTCALDSLKHDYSNLDNYEVDASEKAINTMASNISLNNNALEYMGQSETIPELECFTDTCVFEDSLVWWSNQIETKLAPCNNFTITSVIQPQGIPQDYELGYSM